jgi:hypothetical protein
MKIKGLTEQDCALYTMSCETGHKTMKIMTNKM